MPKKLLLILPLFYCYALMAAPIHLEKTANPTEVDAKRAEQLYMEHCFVCHYAGGAGSPKVGDEQAWNPRLKEGKAGLLKNTLDGINFMPAKGLCTTCSEETLSAIIDYMLSQCPKCDKLSENKPANHRSAHPIKK